jgi:hypothetical protein
VRALTLYTVTARNASDNTDNAIFSLTVNAQPYEAPHAVIEPSALRAAKADPVE